MPIQTVCPECDSVYLLTDRQAGKKVRCKNCQVIFAVPDSSVQQTAIRSNGGKSGAAVATLGGIPTLRFREDYDEPRSVAKKSGKGNMPWIVGGAAVGGGMLVLVCCLLVLVLMRDNKPAEVANNPAPPPAPMIVPQPPPNVPITQPVQGQPVMPSTNPPMAKADNPQPAKTDNPPPAAVEEAPSKPAAANNGRLTAEGRERVKSATVYLRVKMPDGNTAFGTGFFGCKEARNIILTNAHVVGMLSPESMRPQSVEVIVNSGEANEWKTSARVLGVDRTSDLAVLDIGTAPQPVPEPLTIKPAKELHQLDDVWVFGFPYGEQLGKEITIRQASVSALRRKNGKLARVQVNGGIDPGNSGGPVVDGSGSVVGVAVAVWAASRQISFAIPGERVHAILDGRLSELSIQQPYFTAADKIAAPVVMSMIDPRNLIKEVGLEVWAGDKPADGPASQRPPATKQPPAQAGDSPHVYFRLRYNAPDGKDEILLPELPPGKVYWRQPRWINAKGETHWEAAQPMQPTFPPVYRRPANLLLRYTQGNKRSLDLSIDNLFKVSSNEDDSNGIRIRTTAAFTETVASTSQSGTVLTLRYRQPPHRELILPDGQTHSSSKDEQIVNDLPRLVTSVQLDRLGNILRQPVDPRSLLQLTQTSPEQVKSILGFHQMIQQGLESLSVALPPGGTANPLDSWQAERALPIDTPGKTELGKLDMTFTYLGSRKRDGRDEAVLNMDGMVRGKGEGIGGKAVGQILVDLNSGQTLLAETTVKLQLEALLVGDRGERPRPIRVLATMKFRMQRKL